MINNVPPEKLTTSLEEYLKAAKFNHARKGLGFSDATLLQIRNAIMVVNFMMLSSTFMFNDMLWIPLFFTFWGYFISMFSVFATMKATTHYQWQITACVSTEIGHALNLAIMPLFWGLLWPGIAQIGWHWNTWQLMMHMVTLHSVPFISTTINIAVTDMKLLRKDFTKVLFAGYAYMFTNLVGQFIYGQPCYAFTDWVSSPLGALAFCVIAITIVTGLYWGSTYLIDMWAKWMGPEEDEENEEIKEQLFIYDDCGEGCVDCRV